jgi:hypothetical protein
MTMIRTIAIATLLGALLIGCGGAEVTGPPPDNKIDEAEQAISIIRRSFDAMGGLPRLRLAGSKVDIKANVNAGGATFPVEIKLGGPEHYRLDYVGTEIAYVYSEGECRKNVYGVSARCTSLEAKWVTPVRVLVGLTFPAGDAANLRSNFRMRDPISVAGRPCSVAEIRPKNTNYKIRAAYDDGTGLLAQATFKVRDDQGGKQPWQVAFSDWREVKKMQAPFRRVISHQGQVLWDETATEIDFDSYDEREFQAPVPPTTDQALPATFPTRRVVRTQVEGQAVEILAPQPTLGGSSLVAGTAEVLPGFEAIRMVHRGPVAKVSSKFEALNGGALAAGRMTKGEPGVILLEEPPAEGEPALMIIYVAVEPAGAGVKIEGV